MNKSVHPAQGSAPIRAVPSNPFPMRALAMALATILSATALPALAQSKFEGTGRPDPADDAGAYAEGEEATAAGESSNAIGDGASAFGAGALSFANWASAFGFNATAVGENALAVGSQSYAGAAGATAIVAGSNSHSQVTAVRPGPRGQRVWSIT